MKTIVCYQSYFLLSGAFAQQAFAQQARFGRPDVQSPTRPCLCGRSDFKHVSVIDTVQQPIALA